MKKVYLVLSALIAGLLLAGCASILIKPAIFDVKKVALVSVYMNRDFYDVKAPRANEANQALKTLGRAVTKETKVLAALDNAFGKEYQQIVSYGVKQYTDQLDGVGDWQWIPVTTVLNNKMYKTFYDNATNGKPSGSLVKIAQKLKSADWYVAPNMIHIPVDTVAGNPNQHTYYAGDAKDPKEDMRKELAQLCKALGVDAVAMLEFDMAYKKPAINLTLLGADPAIPNMSVSLVMVTKNGDLAVNTGPVVKGQGTRYEGDKVGMLNKEYVDLNAKAVNAYCQAIDNSAADMKKRILSAFSKLGK
ncbi:MAG: hypothetical protein A2252_02710 [Elusimicrobia bacterium RIFOXYA2_FULL_39_19]|nr:MAG: hypothetical protein A2252_02710 [Elusimicrobia bacterium RIFOXYA2_FULL_39_19]